jgi:hypothetical protein
MKKLLWAIMLVVILGCAPAKHQTVDVSLQDKCDAPKWNVGDSWRYRYSNMKEWQYTVERVEEDSYVVDDYYGSHKNCFDRKTLQLLAYIDPKGKKLTVYSPWFIDFPIYVEKQWKKIFTSPPVGGSTDITYLNEYKVISYEDATVPAGTFKAFKIELKQTNYGGRFASGKAYYWYSPEVKFIIKTEHEDIAYWRQSRDYALIKFELKDKQSSPPEIKPSPQKVDTTPKPQTPLPDTLKITPPTTPSKTNVAVVAGTSANIRSGAGNEFSIVAIVKQGDKLILLGESGEWFNVRLENGNEGWVNKMFVK